MLKRAPKVPALRCNDLRKAKIVEDIRDLLHSDASGEIRAWLDLMVVSAPFIKPAHAAIKFHTGIRLHAPNVDSGKRFAAECANILIKQFSRQRPTLDLHCRVAGLVYEFLTGKSGHDLERACRSVRKNWAPKRPMVRRR